MAMVETEMTPQGRSSIAEGTAIMRQDRSSRCGKSWMLNGPQDESPMNDARQAGINADVAQSIVKKVTRFATGMCVIIAIVKVCVYSYSGAAVVKTSALDSMGDLVANCITLYTGIKMNTINQKEFPIGQAKFEPIGVLTFSTLMAATMFSNALNNFEDLLSEEETSREDAIKKFIEGIFGKHKYDADEDTHSWHNTEEGYKMFREKFVTGDDASDVRLLSGTLQELSSARSLLPSASLLSSARSLPPPASLAGPLAALSLAAPRGSEGQSDFIRGLLKAKDFEGVADLMKGEEKNIVSNTIEWAAEVEDEALKNSKMWFTVGFLFCCLSYKFCLWQYCVKIAIPQSGSTILIALANDKRNDFFSTSFVVTTMLLANAFEESLGDWAEMIDPLSSLLLSLVIVYTWITLMADQVVILSSKSVPPEVHEPLFDTVQQLVRSTPLEIEAVKCYHSGSKNVVEVSLYVTDAQTPFATVDEVVNKIVLQVSWMEDVERVLVNTKRVPESSR